MTNDEEACWLFFAGSALAVTRDLADEEAAARAGKLADLMIEEMRKRRTATAPSRVGEQASTSQ